MFRLRIHLRALALAFLAGTLFLCAPAQGQNVDTLLDQSFHAMYNLKFEDALRTAEQAKALDKDDPMPWVAQASALLFREFDRLHILRSEMFSSDAAFDARPASSWVEPNRKQFEGALNGAEKIAHTRMERNKNDVRALFALTLADGMRADDAALISKHNLAALGYTKTATGHAEKLLSLSPEYYDAYIATGMGKYIIGGKPAPVRWMLRLGGLKGNQDEGLKELKVVAEHGRYLAPFARILLAFDDLRHKNAVEARRKFILLHDQFPANPLFQQEIAKCDQPSPASGP
ncbi:MAG TPA: hypothetical protein VNW97_16970 [Candidatus Saccharimonadales bacterium]|nr:hypothetical protein [Candidatus Saccharimonadales bacterium]